MRIVEFWPDTYCPKSRGVQINGDGGSNKSLFRKIIPFGKSFARGALSAGKRFAQSDLGKDIISDTLDSTARAASSAIIDNDSSKAKEELLKSLKRTRKKSSEVAKKIAKDKLESFLSGKGQKSLRHRKKHRRKMNTIFDWCKTFL